MDWSERARVHAALGDETRLRLVDSLWLNDLSPKHLARLAGVESNLMAHHLDVLEAAGVVERVHSVGDSRRRYVTLRWETIEGLVPSKTLQGGSVLFVCTHNSARSQFAEAMLAARAGVDASSAGLRPADRVHPKAIRAARERGIDLTEMQPKGYDEIVGDPDLVVSVCDRAHEAPDAFGGSRLHWSIPDPSDSNRIDGFRSAFDELERRVDLLATALR